MPIAKSAESLLNELGCSYVETVADRRGTLILKVRRASDFFVLKLCGNDGSRAASAKKRLLEAEANMLRNTPQLTNGLYVADGSYKASPWLMIRAVDGPELFYYLKDIREAKQDTVLQYLVLITEFYAKLFKGGYLHGDVQPAHVYLEGDKLTVIDWGLARKIEKPNPLYKGGFIYFVAPEVAWQMVDKKSPIEYTPFAEVYGIGATLFMLYTGHMAMDFGIPRDQLKSTPMARKLERVINNTICSFEQLNVEAFPALESILARALATRPHDRYPDPVVLHAALSGLLGK